MYCNDKIGNDDTIVSVVIILAWPLFLAGVIVVLIFGGVGIAIEMLFTYMDEQIDKRIGR
jgi:hypothetical protein